MACSRCATHQHRDLREQISQRLAKNGWPLRRLDLRRRSLQDRWNEINNWEESAAAEHETSRDTDDTMKTSRCGQRERIGRHAWLSALIRDPLG